MGKKSRRKAKLRAAARLTQGMPVQQAYQPKPLATQVVKPAEIKPAQALVKPVSTALSSTTFNYVLPELRQIAIIAGSLFIILLILAFILR